MFGLEVKYGKKLISLRLTVWQKWLYTLHDQYHIIIHTVKALLLTWINKMEELHSRDTVTGLKPVISFLTVSVSFQLVYYYHGLTSCGVYRGFWWGCRGRLEEWQVVLVITIHPLPSISPRRKPRPLIPSLMSAVATEHSRKVDQ